METKLNTDKVLKFINSTIRGKTATQIARQFGCAKTTASRFVTTLVDENRVVITGTTKTGERGRPGRLFRGNTYSVSGYSSPFSN